mmetsp:Transcript_12154/g.19845  ORF Transcript_12154/g.19845 Transcript_12154/m.19845 type:complete len:373 (+) Transcript_12154:164-1282(+)
MVDTSLNGTSGGTNGHADSSKTTKDGEGSETMQEGSGGVPLEVGNRSFKRPKTGGIGFEGDFCFAICCAIMAHVTLNFDLEESLPALGRIESAYLLVRGESDQAMRDKWPLFAAASVAYIALITKGVTSMRKKGPSAAAGRLLPLWSLVAWVFSFVSFVRLGSGALSHWRYATASISAKKAPENTAEIMSSSFHSITEFIRGFDSVAMHYCKHVDEVLENIPNFRQKLAWLTLFCYSKPFEFIDTIFLVLRKRPVSRLHAIHHLVTMWFAWLNLVLFASPGLVFALINAFVHSLMYCWYFLASIGWKPKRLAIVVTALQNLQMMAGVFVPIYFFAVREECYIPDIYWAVTAAMYSLYIYLFGTLFYDLYVRS